ncbi:MAG: zinc-ribbon domain-containing protein [Gaiellaceae bacterium]
MLCPRCSAENPPGARFCNSCAAPLETVAPAAREERKVVTVLFADPVEAKRKAEPIWREVGATRYVREGEALLAASA